MSEPDPEFTREILRKVRQIEIRSNRLVSEVLAGSYHSAFKGQGIDFEEVREYQPGDEVRTIDWNVTAKMGNPFVKQYREERELTIMLAVDVSASLSYGSDSQSKREKLAELAALLAFSATRNGDKVGILLFTDQVELYLPPAKGQKHVLRILREILFHSCNSKGTEISTGIRFINQVLSRRAVVFLLSDYIIVENPLEEESRVEVFLQQISATRRKHDLICARIHDPAEKLIPDVGLVDFEDAETGELFTIDTSSIDFRNHFNHHNSEEDKNLAAELRRRGIDAFDFSTSTDYASALQEFFRMRENRRRR
jgi:uncharacterized protein (DUF58 family)